MQKFLTYSICCLAFFCLGLLPTQVMGQGESAPTTPFSQSSDLDDITISDFAIGNDYFKDINTLHEQIRLLEKLVDRQDKINDMTSSMVDVGRVFDPAPPPADICKKVPPNFLCNPELIPDSQDVGTLEPSPPAVQQPLPILKAGEAVKKDTTAEERKLYKGLGWTDITCRGMDCMAVIVDTNSNARVQVGGNDTAFGFPVADISTGRVAIYTKKNGIVNLNPVPVVLPADDS